MMRHPQFIKPLSLVLLLCCTMSYAYANTIEVDSTRATMGTISLRQAVLDAATSGDTITFASAIDGDTIKLTTEIVLNKNLVIIGNDTPNPSTGSGRRTIIDRMATSRIFHIPFGRTVHISESLCRMVME
jgi:hypothetical protein